MTIKEKLSALRAIMERESLDAYIISGTDPHNSEYLPAAWKQRQWISGFTGSFGTVVVLKNEAGLWTDTRYFIQAEKQLKDSGIQMHKLRVPEAVDYPEWLATNLPEGSRVGLDSFCISVCDMKNLQETLTPKQITVVEKTDLLGEIWLDRPSLPDAQLFLVPAATAGKSANEKITMIREKLQAAHADYMLFSCLDEIAWLYNVRCNDIIYNPVAISYAVVGKAKAWLFIKNTKVSREIASQLSQEGIEIRDYHHLFLFLEELDKNSVFTVDSATLNYAVYHKLFTEFQVKEQESPIVLAKAIKNPIEVEGFRKACIKDSVALTKFFYWVERNIGNHLTEISVSEQLSAFRAQNDGYAEDSFANISAYGANAALPHYSAIPGEDAELQPRGFYLIDSGGQYTNGTTDITRTVPLGELLAWKKKITPPY